MSVLAACLSHTPLQGHFDPEPAVLAEVEAAVGTLRSRVAAFDPELVFLFAPDHFNGFFYDIMPQFCIATAADALGDFGTLSGPINVASAAAGDCARFLISSDIDIAVSHRMQVDHGFAGPLKDLFGSLSTPRSCPSSSTRLHHRWPVVTDRGFWVKQLDASPLPSINGSSSLDLADYPMNHPFRRSRRLLRRSLKD